MSIRPTAFAASRCAALLLPLALTACGGSDGGATPPPTPIPSVTVSAPAVATVSAGGTSTTAITVARTGGFSGTITLRVAGVPSGVTASITPSTLEAGASSASITWTAIASVASSTHAVTVIAGGAGLTEVSAAIQLTLAPPAPRATTLELVAGNAQRVGAGMPLPVAPRVRVLDQHGASLAGVTVTFAVDSGAALLGDTVAVTDAAGEAALGHWRPAPGRSVVRVTAPGVAPLRLHAFGEGALMVADSLLANGGDVTVRRPGDPLHGLAVSIPAEAFGTAVRLRIRYGDTAAVTLRTGVRLAAPVITLTVDSDSAAGLAPVRLRIPARVAANEAPTVMLIDPSTGALDILPTIREDSLFVVALAPSLSPPAGGGQAARAGLRLRAQAWSSTTDGSTAVQLVIGAVNYDELTRDLTTGYRPEVDDWETEPLVMYRPDTRHDNGLPIAAAWYFDHYRTRRGPLRNQFAKAPGIYYSNMLAARLGGEIWTRINNQSLNSYNLALQALASQVTGLTVDSLILLKVKSGLFLTGRPQLLVGRASAASEARTFLLAYGANGNNLQISLGVSSPGPNVPRLLTLTNGRFGSFAWQPRSADDVRAPVTAEYIYSLGETAGIAASTLNRLWDETIAGTIGSDQLPKSVLVTHEQRDIRDTLFIPGDTTRLWIECAECGEGFPVGPGFTPVHAVHGGRVARFRDGSWVDESVNASVRGNGVRIGITWDGQRLGIGTFARSGHWVEWLDVAVKVLRLTVTPETAITAPDTDLKLTASIDRPLPAEPSWHWELGDGRTVVTTVGELVTQYPVDPAQAIREMTVKVTLKGAGVRVATGEATVRVENAYVAWRITQFSVTHRTCLSGDCGSFGVPQFDRLADAPNHGVIHAWPSAARPTLGGRYPTPGVWLQAPLYSFSAPAPDAWTPASVASIPLAHRFNGTWSDPSLSYPALPATGSFEWTGDRSSGIIRGSARPLDGRNWDFLYEIDATKDGSVLAGTMRARGRYVSGPFTIDYTATFRAERIP